LHAAWVDVGRKLGQVESNRPAFAAGYCKCVTHTIVTPMSASETQHKKKNAGVRQPPPRFMCAVQELSLNSPYLWTWFHHIPSFLWYLQSREILLNLSMKC